MTRRTNRGLVFLSIFCIVISMQIAVTGASGLVGRRLVADLATDGHDVVRLVRRPERPRDVQWDASSGSIEAGALDGADAIVHLAGTNVGQRWSGATRRAILASRVEGTRAVAQAAARLDRPPAVLVCASAVGFYGDRDDELLTERATRGSGFLADVVEKWEAAAQPAAKAGIRVVHLRKGIVLSPGGGALRSLLTPFRLGLGGRVGSGRQWWPWLTLDDASAAYRFALTAEVSGPVNVASSADRNADFVRALGRALRRPAVAPLPALAVKLLFGEMGTEMLLASQRVATPVLDEAGFVFADRDLETSLRRLLAR